MSYEEEDICMAYMEEDTCISRQGVLSLDTSALTYSKVEEKRVPRGYVSLG